MVKILFFCIVSFFCFQHVHANDYDLMRRFLFLENKLTQKQESFLYKKAKEYSIKGGISVVASFIFSKLLEYFFWGKIKSSFAQNMITWFTPGAHDYKAAYAKINKLLFLGMIPGFLFLLSHIPWNIEQTEIDVLFSFVKQWPINQMNTPDRFHKTFDALYDLYLQDDCLLISEQCAKEILQYVHDETVSFISNKNNKQQAHAELDEIQKKVSTLDVSDEVREEIQKIIDQLKSSPVACAQNTVLQNHLMWLVDLPWGMYTKDCVDIKQTKKILDKHHFGLEEVKENILDFLAVQAFRKKYDGPILCLCGPPGVGKTSIGKSIAKSMNKKFFRISLGGVTDESEIRGHRKTYIGAMPGRIMQAIKKTGSCNPVIMLDEIDKMGGSTQGDPYAALLEVLDPEQNKTFYDNYLGVHFDLSKICFLATANDIDRIPKPLKDRMNVIMLRGYTVEEKFEIAKRHVLAQAIKDAGLSGKGFVISDDVLMKIIACDQEPGMRGIKRCINKLCAKFARRLLETRSLPLCCFY